MMRDDEPVERGLKILQSQRVLQGQCGQRGRRRAWRMNASLGPFLLPLPPLLALTTVAAAAKRLKRKEKRASMVEGVTVKESGRGRDRDENRQSDEKRRETQNACCCASGSCCGPVYSGAALVDSIESM